MNDPAQLAGALFALVVGGITMAVDWVRGVTGEPVTVGWGLVIALTVTSTIGTCTNKIIAAIDRHREQMALIDHVNNHRG